MNAILQRTAFKTSRLLDFFSERELTMQIGHPPRDWPLVAIKELLDNSLDACEESHIAPTIKILVSKAGIEVSDNGPGLPARVIEGVLDFSVRVSSREAYVSPTRGAQGNALKTLLAMPFVLDGNSGTVEIASQGERHPVSCTVDRIQQKPIIGYDRGEDPVKSGTFFRMHWPDSALLNSRSG